MRIHATLSGSRANGPGLRSVVWTQGCTLACPGCQNPLTHDPLSPLGKEIDPDALAEQVIREAAPGTTGLTISGGEPMQQALSAYSFMCSIHARRPDWEIGLFTGYTLQELTFGTYAITESIPPHLQTDRMRASIWEHQVKQHLAWAITGRYDRTRPPESMPAHIPWRHAVASANQTLWLFRTKFDYADFPPLLSEVSIDEAGLVQVTGYALKGAAV